MGPWREGLTEWVTRQRLGIPASEALGRYDRETRWFDAIGRVAAGGDAQAGANRVSALVQALEDGGDVEDLVRGLLEDYATGTEKLGGSSAVHEALRGLSIGEIIEKSSFSSWGYEAQDLLERAE